MTSDSNQEYISKERLEQLKTEIEELKTVKRQEISKRIEDAKKFGDLSENAEYQAARELQAATEERIRRLETLVKSATIISETKKGVVGFGSTVTIQKKGEKDKHEYLIVGSEEADMRDRKISHLSPLGAALMGKKKGDVFTFETPGGKQTYTIEKVS